MKRTFFKRGERVDAFSIAGKDMWIYEAYGVRADVFIKGNRAEIPLVKSKNQGEGNFKKWLDEMEKEFEIIQFNTVINPILAKYFTKRGYKKRPKCLNCGKVMIPVKDPIAKRYTGHLWRCECMPKGKIVSIG